jgi:vacuolar-type H+-ATPase subunit E/Vma4
MTTPKEEDRSEFLAFKRALEAEYREKLRGEEAHLDEELGEIVALRRVEVEKEISRRREDQKKRARELQESLKMQLLRDLRQQLAHEVQRMVSSLEVQVFDSLQDLRRSPRYEEALCRFAREGCAMVGDKVLIMVAPGEGDALRILGESVFVEETTDLSEGGCMVIRHPEGDHIVDNSLRSRWEHLVREVSKEISHHVAPFFDQLEEAL